ncbi:vault protein inter-alpha-trypsin [Stagonosporopsis vannaccii]|nr:vault protein inter-alpha-trypsin [Stagonosporopsis vannaccii]
MPICGLYYNARALGSTHKTYLPQVQVKVHASILATTSRTVLQQTFVNPSITRAIREVRYAFPLYDGVSVVGFSCHVGNRLIVGEVKEREKAKQVYSDAVARGETAGLLEQLPEASDVFTTAIGNIPPGATVIVKVTYLGELKHDMEVDGIRFTIPTSICPRYGNVHGASLQQLDGTISITVDAEMAEGSFIQRLQSPSHPIAMSMGTTSADPDAVPSMNRASATLSLGVAHLDADFVLQVVAQHTGVPKAILETHPTIPNHRALMATLVPKFTLPPENSEIVFICDQSGSMQGPSMTLAKEALQVFLKSLRVGVKFNICSFGSRHSFLFPRSASYGQDTLADAVRHALLLDANFGGTEMLAPIKATIDNRYKDMSLDIILLTDGEIWNQDELFGYLNEQIQENKAPIRVFTLGVGSGVSHALIEGVARAGNGFSQSVQEGEKMSSKVVRMLKGAQSPHVNDYTLEVKYSSVENEDDFEIVEKVADSLKVNLDLKDKASVADTVSTLTRMRDMLKLMIFYRNTRNRSLYSTHLRTSIRTLHTQELPEKTAMPTFRLYPPRKSCKRLNSYRPSSHSIVQLSIF